MLEEPKHAVDSQQESSLKKQKTLSIPDTVSMTIEDNQVSDDRLNDQKMDHQMTTNDEATSSSQCVSPDVSKHSGTGVNLLKHESTPAATEIISPPVDCKWKPLEKELYVKGLEIFGKNRYGVLLINTICACF